MQSQRSKEITVKVNDVRELFAHARSTRSPTNPKASKALPRWLGFRIWSRSSIRYGCAS